MIKLLTFEEAKKIGINACVDKLGRDFVKKNREYSCTSYGDADQYAFCFVGIDNHSEPNFGPHELVLDGDSKWPYKATCNVWYKDGRIEFLDCIIPGDLQTA